MNKTLNNNGYYFILILILIIFVLILTLFYYKNSNDKCTMKDDIINNKLQKIEDRLDENYENNKRTVVSTINYPTAIVDKDPKDMNSLEEFHV